MRLLWWTMEYAPDPGGIATMARHVAGELVARGHEVTVLVHGRAEGDANEAGVRIVRLPTQRHMLDGDRASLLEVRHRVAELKREVATELYHFHPCDGSAVLHHTTHSAHPAPSVVTLHGEAIVRCGGARPGSLLARMLDDAELITAVGSGIRRDLLAARPDLASKVVVVPNGLPENQACPTPVPDEPLLVAVSRFRPSKALDQAVAAMPAVVAAVPAARLLLVGDGEERAALQSQVHALALHDVVRFPGHQTRERVWELLTSARALVQPSRYEGLPMITLEAALAGRPVVATRVPGITDIVRDGVTGLLVEPGDVDALARAMVRVCTDDALVTGLGEAARARVAAAFSIDSVVDSYEQAYEVTRTRAGHTGRRGRSARAEARSAGTGRPPTVSVVVPARQAARTVGETVTSALAQTKPDLEVIVVNDGSDDDTATVARRCGGDDHRLVVLEQPRAGQSSARNAGLAMARGRFVAFLDADDRWPPGRLEGALAALAADPAIDAVFGRAFEFHDADDPPPPGTRQVQEPAAVRLPTTMLARAEAVGRLGPFPDVAAGDVTWLLAALDAGLRYVSIDDTVLERRVHGKNRGVVDPEPSRIQRLAALKASLDRRRFAAGPVEPGPRRS